LVTSSLEVKMGGSVGVVVVTGAGSGIGRAVARRLLDGGDTVVAVGRRAEPLRSLTRAAPDPDAVLAVPMDVTEPTAPARLGTLVRERYGHLDGLVNCAGLARFAPLESASLADLDRMLAVNLRAPAALIQAFLPELTESGGSVVNVTSVGGVLAMPGRAFYGATKAAINSLTRSLARELAPRVRVNAVVPGPVETPMYEDLGLTPAQTESLRAGLLGSTPMARFGRAEEVARWVHLLLDREQSGWVTGALLAIDGGRSA
jgi:NAD(P)-dependent dehydrogenase (short-subunit alcohol dehydrogenase family)